MFAMQKLIMKVTVLWEIDLHINMQAICISHLKYGEEFWRQKSRINWLAEREASTTFFHSY